MVVSEDGRKARQRALQQKARALQLAGKSPAEIKAAMKDLKRQAKRSDKGRDVSRKRARQWRGQFDRDSRKRKERGGPEISAEARELGRKHHLVIIPIFWKRKDEEMDKVLAAAASLKQKLVSYKLNVWIDQRKSLTPGQKYNYWEHVGVKVRAEIGPQEAAKGEVVLSKLTTPGEVAQRWKGLKVKSPLDVKAFVKRVKEEGAYEWIDIDSVPLGSDEDAAPGKGDRGLGSREEVEIKIVASKVEADQARSGDSLEVNYLVE